MSQEEEGRMQSNGALMGSHSMIHHSNHLVGKGVGMGAACAALAGNAAAQSFSARRASSTHSISLVPSHPLQSTQPTLQPAPQQALPSLRTPACAPQPATPASLHAGRPAYPSLQQPTQPSTQPSTQASTQPSTWPSPQASTQPSTRPSSHATAWPSTKSSTINFSHHLRH